MKIQTEIQKWGNGLGLRVSGAMRTIPGIKPGTPVEIDITEDGFSVIKIIPSKNPQSALFSEAELIDGLTASTAHADEVPNILSDEYEL